MSKLLDLYLMSLYNKLYLNKLYIYINNYS